jgi:hypothetical protein
MLNVDCGFGSRGFELTRPKKLLDYISVKGRCESE